MKLAVRRCTAVTRSGKPCEAAPVGGTKPARCIMHTPGSAALLGMKGGRRRAIFSPEGLVEFEAPKNASDLLSLLAQTIIEVRCGRLDPKVANSVSYLGAGLLNALEVADHEVRLRALEKHYERQDRS